MHAGDDHNQAVIDTIVDPIGKPSDKRPSGVSMNDRIRERLGTYALEHRPHGNQEFIAQSATLALIPEESNINIGGGRRTNDD